MVERKKGKGKWDTAGREFHGVGALVNSKLMQAMCDFEKINGRSMRVDF